MGAAANVGGILANNAYPIFFICQNLAIQTNIVCATYKNQANALRMAIFRRQPGTGLLFHSDRGSQYCSKDFQDMLKKHQMISSMSRKGNCWDNAVAESFFGSLKTERVFFSSYATRDAARMDIVDYIEML